MYVWGRAIKMGKTSIFLHAKMVYVEFRILGVRIKYNLSPVEITITN